MTPIKDFKPLLSELDSEYLCRGYFEPNIPNRRPVHKVLKIDLEHLREMGKGRFKTPVGFVVTHVKKIEYE